MRIEFISKKQENFGLKGEIESAEIVKIHGGVLYYTNRKLAEHGVEYQLNLNDYDILITKKG